MEIIDKNGTEEIEISLEEFHNILQQQETEVEIDLDEVEQFIEELRTENALEETRRLEHEELADEMRQALLDQRFRRAFDKAAELKLAAYPEYRDEIEECISVCADNDVTEALILMAEKYTVRGDGMVKGEAFPYLKKLADMGYIKSYQWIADCYYYGIGCKPDIGLAGKYYWMGLIYGVSDLCRNRCVQLDVRKMLPSGDLWDRLFDDLTRKRGYDSEDARVKIADMILSGQYRGFGPETAYYMLKEWSTLYDIGNVRLGECLLYGIGVERDPVVARYILDSAYKELNDVVCGFEDGIDRDVSHLTACYGFQDFVDAYNLAEKLIAEANDILKEMELKDGSDEVFDEESCFEEWDDTKNYFVMDPFALRSVHTDRPSNRMTPDHYFNEDDDSVLDDTSEEKVYPVKLRVDGYDVNHYHDGEMPVYEIFDSDGKVLDVAHSTNEMHEITGGLRKN